MNVCLDVYYCTQYAKACAVVFQPQPTETVVAEYCSVLPPADEYVPGEFYRRELPCLLKVYQTISEDIELAIVDGYVWLGKGKKGLGAHLYDALDAAIPIIGVAKTHFHGNEDCQKVYRGGSNQPLYVTSIGMNPDHAPVLVERLKGEHRIPEVLRRVDRLTRSCGTGDGA